ncbi:MAG: hypothetical protein JST79_07160 [Acidobacteria bacterium]|nr:hypothetical protein [Acidobacteriota bacterium]
MSVAGISSTSAVNSLLQVGASAYSQRQSFRSGLQQLYQALQSGDLTTAQQAYNSLTQNGTSPFRNSQLAQDFAAVGQALQAGDISGAQQAFATFQQDVQTVVQAHHHHHHRGGNSATPPASQPGPDITINLGSAPALNPSTTTPATDSGTTDLAPTAPAATPTESVTVNVGGSNSAAAGQVTLNIGNSADNGVVDQVTFNVNGSGNSTLNVNGAGNGDQITLNVNGSNGEQIVLNFGAGNGQAQQPGVVINLQA